MNRPQAPIRPSRGPAASLALIRTLALGLVALGAAAAPATAELILRCDFDDQPLDQPIGTGGAAAHQPVEVLPIEPVVRTGPFATPSLEYVDDSDGNAEYTRYRFLNDWEITEGQLEIEMNLRFEDLDQYIVAVREPFASAANFANLTFNQFGAIWYGDGDTSSVRIGDYTTGTTLHLEIRMDVDRGLVTVLLDSVELRSEEPWGGPFAHGPGSILVGFGGNPVTAGTFYLDDLHVQASVVPTSVAPTTWAEVKAAHR
ncbi:MAG: hypothetical protein R3B81_06110 [bacterium]